MVDTQNTDQVAKRDAFEVKIADAKARHPEINPQIFDDLRDLRRAGFPAYQEYYNQITANNAQGIAPDARTVNKLLAKYQEEIQAKDHAELEKRYSKDEINKAFKAVAREINGPSIIDRVTEPFYNEEKGGIQYGGIIGAVLFALGAYKMTGGMGGGVLGVLAMVALTALGAYGGNLVGDWVKNRNSPQPSGNSPEIQPTLVRSQQRGQGETPTQPISPELAAQARAATDIPSSDVQTASLPPSSRKSPQINR